MSEVIIFGYRAADELPSSSPFCLKVIWAAQLKQIPYTLEVVTRAPLWSARGLLPAATVKGKKLQDSAEILGEFDTQYAHPSLLLYPEDPALLAETQCLEDWADEHLKWFLLYYRWNVDIHLKKFTDQIFEAMPPNLRAVTVSALQKRMQAAALSHGIGKYNEPERVEKFKKSLNIMEQKIKRNGLLVHSQITAADLSCYAMIKSIQKAKITELSTQFEHYPAVSRWIEKIDGQLK